jgi:hypothetical protein
MAQSTDTGKFCQRTTSMAQPLLFRLLNSRLRISVLNNCAEHCSSLQNPPAPGASGNADYQLLLRHSARAIRTATTVAGHWRRLRSFRSAVEYQVYVCWYLRYNV